MWVGPTSEEEYGAIDRRRRPAAAELYRRAARHRRQPTPRRSGARFPDIPRRVSGYNLDSLLPENGFDLARALVGCEGTLVTVLHAELRPGAGAALPRPGGPRLRRHRTRRRRRAPRRCEHDPIAARGHGRTAGTADARGARLPRAPWTPLPEGERLADGAVRRRQPGRRRRTGRARCCDALGGSEHDATVAFSDDPAREQEMLEVREAGLGATARAAGRAARPGRAGRTPPSRRSGSGDYLRDLQRLLRRVRLRRTPPCTGTSGRAACTPASPSSSAPPKASPPSAASSTGPPTWSSPTAGRCPASTATGRRAGELLPGCSATELVERRSARSRPSSTRTTG